MNSITPLGPATTGVIERYCRPLRDFDPRNHYGRNAMAIDFAAWARKVKRYYNGTPSYDPYNTTGANL